MDYESIVFDYVEDEKTLTQIASIYMSVFNGEPWKDKWTFEGAFDRLKHFYDSPNHLGLYASIGKGIVGCLVGNIEPFYSGDYFHLKEMFVVQQRQGIGSSLINKLGGVLKEKGVKSIFVFTGNNGYPIEFYKKNGFESTNMSLLSRTIE